MEQSLEELRQALRRLRQDIESQARSVDAAPQRDEESREAPTPPPAARLSAPVAEDASIQPVEGRRERTLARARLAAAPDAVREPPASLVDESVPVVPQGSGALVWPRVIQAAGLAAAAAGAFAGIRAALASGLVVCLAGVLAGGLSQPCSSGGSEGLAELAARVAALERRLSAASRASEAGAVSAEVVEEIVELRRILATLFRALEKPAGEQ